MEVHLILVWFSLESFCSFLELAKQREVLDLAAEPAGVWRRPGKNAIRRVGKLSTRSSVPTDQSGK